MIKTIQTFILLCILVYNATSACTHDPLYVSGCALHQTTNTYYAMCPCHTCSTGTVKFSQWRCCNSIYLSNCDFCRFQGCQRCYSGYTPVNGYCQNCMNHMSNCATCDSISNCLTCLTHYIRIASGGNYICTTCSSVILLCNQCNNTHCTKCQIGYQLNANSNACITCLDIISYCTNCQANLECQTCASGYLTNNNNKLCLTCSQLIYSCTSCISYNQCVSCAQDFKIQQQQKVPKYYCVPCLTILDPTLNVNICLKCNQLMNDCNVCNISDVCISCHSSKQVINGCTKVKGCFKVNPLLPITNNCLKCNPTQFLDQPQNQKCVCKKGKPVGDYCFDQPGCTNIYVYNNVLTCVSCNYSLSLIFNNGSCFCKTYFQWSSAGQQACVQICADGYLINLQCDDGNTINGDGCSSLCKRETNYTCIDTGMIPASSCTFKAKIQLYVSQIRKQTNTNQAIITFSILPYSSILQKVNFTNLYKFELNNAQIVSFIVAEGKLKVHIKYNASIEGFLCKLQLNYGYVFVRSPKSIIEFQMVQSFGDKLLFYDYLNLPGDEIKDIIFILSVTSLLILSISSFAYKLIGVETIHIIQFCCIIISNTQYYQLYFSFLFGLSLSFGNINIPFHKQCKLSPVFCRLGYFDSSFEAFIILGSIQIIFLIVFAILKVAICFQKNKKQNNQTRNISTLICFQRAKQIWYNTIIFPAFIGFMPIILISGLSINLKYLPKSDSFVLNLCYLIISTTFSIIFFNEIFNYKKKKRRSKPYSIKSQYPFYYNCYSLMIVALIQVFLITKEQYLLIAIIFFIALFNLLLFCKKWYRKCLQKYCLFLSNLILIFGIIFVLMIQSNQINNINSILVACIYPVMIGIIEAIAIFRILQIFYKKIQRYCAKKIPEIENNKQLIQRQQKLTIEQASKAVREQIDRNEAFENKILNMKKDTKQLLFHKKQRRQIYKALKK